MTTAAGSNRARLERELAEIRGVDAEELQSTWGAHRRACPFEKLDAAEAAELLGSQRGPYGGTAGDLYIAWATTRLRR